MRLSELLEFLFVYSQLVQDSVEERRTNLPSAVDRNRRGASVVMLPTFVASRLTRSQKTQLAGGPAKLVRTGARHARSRLYRRSRSPAFFRAHPHSTNKQPPTPPS